MPRIAATVLVLLVVCRGSAASAQDLDPELRISQYVHDAWTVEEGLPQNSAITLTQGPAGYLWIGTQAGLARFDGIDFEVIDARDGLGSSEVRALLAGRDSSLWIGTNGGGLTRYRSGTLTRYTSEDGLPNDVIRSLYEDRDGHLWIGTIDGGLSRYDGAGFRNFSAEDGLAGDVVLAISESRDGTLWIGTHEGLSTFRDGTFTNYGRADGLPGDLIWALEPDGEGGFWIGAMGGVARMRGGEVIETYGRDDGLCGEIASSLVLDTQGALWIGTLGGGVCRLHEGRFDQFSEEDGLTNNRVRHMAADREGSLWIGTESGGVNRLRQGKFTYVAAAEGLADEMVMAVTEDNTGRMWIGTKSGGLHVFDAATNDGGSSVGRLPAYPHPAELPSTTVYALSAAGERLWVGMFRGGLCRIEAGSTVCYDGDDGLPSANVYSVHEDRSGRLWIGTDAGLAIFEGGSSNSSMPAASDGAARREVIRPYPGDARLAAAPITIIHEDREGDIWIGLHAGGMMRIRGDHATRVGAGTDFANATVTTMHEDEAGRLWAGAYGDGLCRIEGGEVSCLTSENGLPGDQVLQVLTDGAGGLWVGTQQGIGQMVLQDVVDVLDGRRAAAAATSYGRADGLKGTEVNGGTQPSAWKSADGRLWFATNRGIAGIHPSQIRTNTIPPPVLVESISVNGAAIDTKKGEAIRLEPGSRDVTFRYAGLSLTAPEEVRFEYRLEGYDEQWIPAGSRREAYYTNLQPGDYRFVVRAANSDGIWNEAGATVSFELLPFFHQTIWFKLLGLMLALICAFAGYRLRIRQVRRRERELERTVDERTHDLRLEKERTEKAKKVIEGQAEKLRELDRFKTRFFANVSHEFRTPLTMIVGPLENMLTGAVDPSASQRQVELMHRNAMRLMRLINQLLDLSKLEDGRMTLKAHLRDVVPFAEGIVLSCTAFAERKGVDLAFRSDPPEIPVCFEPDKLEKVFYNLLSNAIKFTPEGGRIDLELVESEPTQRFPEGALRLTVHDTGKGIPEDQLEHIFDRFHQVDGSNTREHEGTGIGLSLVKELILLHRGSVDVESTLGEGTTFTIMLPLGTAHLAEDELVSDEDMGMDEAAIATGAMAELASPDFDFMHEDEAPIPVNGSRDAEPSSDDPLPAPIGDEDGRLPLLLVVDDNRDVRDYVAGVLSDEYRIATARDGADGLEKANELVPDLIISDVMMPNVDGNAFCRAVKSSPELYHVPVILLTARATHELKMEGLEVGADDYIPKPFNVHELKVRIRNLLRLRHQEKELKELNDHLEAKVQEQFQELVRERRRYEEELIASKERAEASDRLKSAILNNLSHEFRTPLTAILGFNEILSMETGGELQEFTDEIDRGSRRLLRTLDSLLQLSRIEAEDLGGRAERVDLVVAAGTIAERYGALAAEKGLELRVEPPGSQVTVELDPSALEEVLENLIDNAVKFTKAGEVRVEIGEENGRAVVRVADTGVGIGADFLPQIYDAFKQESDDLNRAFEGVGLGLTIAKRLTELMDGTIEVASVPGEGTTITLRFPALRQEVGA